MKEKLIIAKRLWDLEREYNIKYIKLIRKCYRAYLVDCVVKGKNEFSITFKDKHVICFDVRMKDWYNYVLKRNISLKPMYLKTSTSPDEIFLKQFLRKYGFRIADEHFKEASITYDVTIVWKDKYKSESKQFCLFSLCCMCNVLKTICYFPYKHGRYYIAISVTFFNANTYVIVWVG